MTALRVCVLLAAAGLFVAASLLFTDLSGTLIPCGASSGCEKVHNDAWSRVAGIPTSFFGVATYLAIIALLCAPRSSTAAKTTFALLLAGSLSSIVLTFRSAWVIHALCLWCVASAVIICALFCVYANFVTEQSGERRPDWRVGIFAVLTAFCAAFAVSHFGRKDDYKHIERRLTPPIVADLLAQGTWYGNKNAATKIVMFGDFECPTCRAVFTRLFRVIKQRDNCAFAFVNSPLAGHEYGTIAGIYSKIAAEKGRFWDFAAFAMAQETLSVEALERRLHTYGVSSSTVLNMVANADSDSVKAFNRDLQLGSRLRLSVTPVVLRVRADTGSATVIPLRDLASERTITSLLTF